MKNINNKKEIGGYTIIETMIAISLFIIIIMAGMGALLNANLLHRKSQSMRSIMDNLSFIMDDVSKNLRTGYSYRCINNGADFGTAVVSTPLSGSSCWGVAFEYQNGVTGNSADQWVYYIGLYGGKNGIFKSVDGGSTFTQLTSDEIIIDTTASSFSVLGALPPSSLDNQQPFITIKLVGKITVDAVDSPFSLQTSVSQRAVDI